MLLLSVLSLLTVQSVLSPVIRQEVTNTLRKLRSAVDATACIPSIQRLAEAQPFLDEFGPRSEKPFHLSFTDDAVAKMAKQGRECIVEAREVIANLAECLENDEPRQSHHVTIAEAKRLIETLGDVRKASTKIDALRAKFEKSQTFNAAIDEATAALGKMSLGSVKASLDQFACNTQRSFWSAECEKEVDSAVDAITSKLADFDLERWQAAHERAVAAEEAKRAEDHQRRIREVEIAKVKEEKRKVEAAAARQKEKDAVQKKKDDAARIAKDAAELRLKEALLRREPKISPVSLEQKEIEQFVLPQFPSDHHYRLVFVTIYTSFRAFRLLVGLTAMLGLGALLPNYYMQDGHCSWSQRRGFYVDSLTPLCGAEIVVFLFPGNALSPIHKTFGFKGKHLQLYPFAYMLLGVISMNHVRFSPRDSLFPVFNLCSGNGFYTSTEFVSSNLVRLTSLITMLVSSNSLSCDSATIVKSITQTLTLSLVFFLRGLVLSGLRRTLLRR